MTPRCFRSGIVLTLIATLGLGGCAAVQVRDDVRHGALPWQGASGTLGNVSVWPETTWRADQKEKPQREAMALTAISKAFRDLPYGQVKEIRPIAAWDEASEASRLQEAKAAGIDSVAMVRVSELGPILHISLPVLWSTYSDVQFRLRIVRLASGETLLDAERNRRVGGPFALRGTEPLAAEMEIALRDALGLPAR